MKFLVFLLFILIYNSIASQAQIEKVFYYDKNGEKVNSMDSAFSFRQIIAENDTTFLIEDFYVTGRRPKLMGYAFGIKSNIIFNGVVVSFYENGSKSEELNYKKGQLFGESKHFYSNGKVKDVVFYNKKQERAFGEGSDSLGLRMINAFDKLGGQMVKDGNGYFKDTVDGVFIRGKYRDGYKDSIWLGDGLKQVYSYKELYDRGKLISGSAAINESKYLYTKLEVPPQFPGGNDNFYKYIGKSYKVPKEIAKAKISGNIYCQFVIDTDGSLKEMKILKDLGHGSGDEIVRVLERCPKWLPGRLHGIPVRTSYVVPVNIKSSY